LPGEQGKQEPNSWDLLSSPHPPAGVVIESSSSAQEVQMCTPAHVADIRGGLEGVLIFIEKIYIYIYTQMCIALLFYYFSFL
jgi:hypothetical protein